MTKGKANKLTIPQKLTIFLAIIACSATILSAAIPPLIDKLQISLATETPMPTNIFTPPPTDAPTSTFIPSSTPTLTPTLTYTPSISPLQGIFPSITSGVEFMFPDGKPDLITRQFVEKGDCVHSAPYGLQLIYNLPGGRGWGIHWANPPLYHFDITGTIELTFWVKGTNGGETFYIGLKDTASKEIKVYSERYVLVSASEWRQVILPLNHFADNIGFVNIASIENMNISFESKNGAGSICIDDIAFQ